MRKVDILLCLMLFIYFVEIKSKVYQENADIYHEKYWEYQMPQGSEGAILELFKFAEFIKPTDTVIDFGCGGGYLLNLLPGKVKIGIDINPNAFSIIESYGVKAYREPSEVPNEIADVIITNHALEHVFNPFEVLQELYKKLKHNGLLIIVVPSEQAHDDNYQYSPDEPNHHVYTWTPQTLGNLVIYAGFYLEKAESIRHCWVGNFGEESKKPGFSLEEFHEKCRMAALEKGNYQIRVIARKK